MKPGVYNIVAKQSDWTLGLNWMDDGAPKDLADFTAALVVRYKAESDTVVLALTSEVDGGITLDGEIFNIEFDVDEATMKAIKAGQYVYDLELADGDGKSYPVLTGRFTVEGSTIRLPPSP